MRGHLKGAGHPAIETIQRSQSPLTRPLTEEEVRAEGLERLRDSHEFFWDYTHTLVIRPIGRSVRRSE